jgi:hypothetical protein
MFLIEILDRTQIDLEEQELTNAITTALALRLSEKATHQKLAKPVTHIPLASKAISIRRGLRW